MRGALLDRPVLHGVCNDARRFVIQPLSRLDRALYLLIGFRRQALFHHGVAEDVFAKNLGNISHRDLPFSMALMYYFSTLKSRKSMLSFVLDADLPNKVYC